MTTLDKLSLASFLSACGAAGPLVLDVEGPEPGESRRRVLEQPFAVVGRDPRADLCLDEWHVSRRHAYLQLIDGRWFCIDLHSQTSTHWADGQRRYGWIEPGEAIDIGPFRLRVPGEVNGKHSSGDPLNDRVADSPALPGATLEFLSDGVAHSTWRMTRVLALVGQAPECKVRLVSPNVSKFHCSLLRTRRGLWLVDLLGRGGVRVNGQPSRWTALGDGDEFEVGEITVRVRWEGPAPDSPHRNGSDRSEATGPRNPLVITEAKPVVLLPERTQTETEVIQRLLVPLVHEFRLMQQQMFDQFQSAMTSMFDMFTSLHHEQSDLIRDELERLRELTQELHTLQEELAKHPPHEAVAAPLPTAPPPLPEGPSPPVATLAPEPPVTDAARPPGPAVATPPAENAEDIHVWLTQRMATLQRERQSSWQRILNFLLGKGP